MLYIELLDVASFEINELTVTWAFQPTHESLTRYTLDIYRSEAPGEDLTGYDIVASGIDAGDYSYTDPTVSGLYDPLRTWYYKVNLTNTTTLEESVQPDRPGYKKGRATDRVALELIHRKSISLNQYSGRDFTVLKRRTYGTHCTDC